MSVSDRNIMYFANCKVKDARLYEENGLWYMEVTYTYEDDHIVEEIHIPKIGMDLANASLVTNHYKIPYLEFHTNRGSLKQTDCDGFGVYYTVKKTDKPEKATLEEIEKRLGYKVELVSRKGD